MSKDIELAKLLGKLPGRRLIYTNGSVAHAKRITGQLGIEHLFDDVFDIVASRYIPKPAPEPYDEMIKTFNIDPKRSLMVLIYTFLGFVLSCGFVLTKRPLSQIFKEIRA